MARVAVLGAGFGGIATAVALRSELRDADEVLLVERSADFAMGLRKSWHALRLADLEAGTRPLAALESRGIDVLRGEITEIAPAVRRVTVGGTTIDADALIVALGAAHAPESVPGLVEHGVPAWSRAGARGAREAIDQLLEAGSGRAVIGIFGSPYSCPPAPYELALLLRDRLDATADPQAYSVDVFTPAPISLPVLGAAECSRLDARLAARGIGFHAAKAASEVREGAVVFADGSQLAFDLLLAVPPHRVPPVLVRAGLAAEGGWVPVDRHTLETRWPGVHAIGDCVGIPLTNGLPLAKAGLLAELQGQAAAARIAAALRGDEPQATFGGRGTCFIEMGGGEAATISGDFYAEPPRAELSDPSRELMAAKHAFEEERLRAWFG